MLYGGVCFSTVDTWVYIVKPVLSVHLWDKEKVIFKDKVTSWKRFNSYKIFYDRTRKRWPFKTGDCMGRFDCICLMWVWNNQSGLSVNSNDEVYGNMFCFSWRYKIFKNINVLTYALDYIYRLLMYTLMKLFFF